MNKRLEQFWQRRFRMGALLLLALLASWATHAAEAFLEPEQAFRLQVQQAGPAQVTLHWTIAPGYYLYRDRLSVASAAGGSVGVVTRPAGERKADPNFGEVEVYHQSVTLQAERGQATALRVGWQGCAEAGLCYPPQQQTIRLEPAVAGAIDPVPRGAGAAAIATEPAAPDTASGPWSESGVQQLWSGQSLWWSVPLAFVLGLGLAFTPCMLPMVPILSGMVVGQQASGRRALLLSVSFVVPMALVYAGLGVLAAVAGAGLQAALQNPWAITAFAGLFAVLAFSMFGFYELQLPAMVRDRLASASPAGGSVAGAAALGVLSALLVGPCMTAPLAGTLLYIAQSGNVAQGALLLFALGLGMGVPLIVISTVGSHWLPRPGAWMNRVKGAFGFVLLATAVWMLQRVAAGPLPLLLWGALLVAAALALWHAAAPRAGDARAWLLFRSGAAVAALWGGAMVLGAAGGATDPLRPLAGAHAGETVAAAPAGPSFETAQDPAVLRARLASAQARGQPVLLEFSAQWCTSCRTIEREVFSDAQVLRALDGVLLLRADVTAGDAAQRAFMREHQVMGPPTVMLFDGQGRERRPDRLVGEFPPDELLRRVPAGKERA